MSPSVKMPISCNFIVKKQGEKDQKDSKMGIKNIHHPGKRCFKRQTLLSCNLHSWAILYLA